MAAILIARMQAAIVGQAVTLTKVALGVGEALPPHLDGSSIVFNSVANPAPPEFWQAASTGMRYRVTIEQVT